MGILGDRLSQVGGVIFGGGLTLGVGWGIWAAQSPAAGFWDWPMWPAIAMCVAGGAMLVVSFVGAAKASSEGISSLKQSQSSGARSVNMQAGHDVTYNADGRP